MEDQADDINAARLRNAVNRADNLFAKHVALDGTKAVERHRLAARKANVQHKYVTTKQHGVYEAIREFPVARHPKPRRIGRNRPPTVPSRAPPQLPTPRRSHAAPAPVVRKATWRTQHRADTPRPPGFGGQRRVHFAPPARPRQDQVYHRQPAPSRPTGVYQGRLPPPPYRPPQLFPKNQQYRQPYQKQYPQQPYRGLPWKFSNYYEPLTQG